MKLDRKGSAHRLHCELLEDRLSPNNLLGLADAVQAAPAPVAWLDPVVGIFANRPAPAALRSLADGLPPSEPQAVAVSGGAVSLAASALTPAKAQAVPAPAPLPTRGYDLAGLVMVEGLGDPGGAGPGRHDNPGVLPPNSRPYGATYSQWAVRWWQALAVAPVVNDQHPALTGGAFGDERALFLAGVGGGVTLNLTIRPGTPIFFPVITAECSVIEPDPFHGDTEAEMRACANHHMDHTSGHFAILDGRPVNNLDAYRVESPLYVFGPLPENNILAYFGIEAPAGATSPSVLDGQFLFLAPLSVGTHTIHFGANFDELGFGIDTTYNITVRP